MHCAPQYYARMETGDPDMAARLKSARRHKGFRTATEAAKAMGVPVPTYLGHENGSRGFLTDIPRYARFFGVRWQWLQRDEGPMVAGRPGLEERIAQLPADKKEQVFRFVDFLEKE